MLQIGDLIERHTRRPIDLFNKVVMNNKFAVLDFETTGLYPNRGDRAIEIGIVLFDGTSIVETYHSLINPRIAVPYFIQNLTGITQRMVDNAPESSIVMRDALEFIGDATLVAHNASFDKKFFVKELNNLGRSYFDDFICTMLISRRLYPQSSNHKLATLANNFGIDSGGHHRALADAMMTAKLLSIILEHLRDLYCPVLIDRSFLLRYQRKKISLARSYPGIFVPQSSNIIKEHDQARVHTTQDMDVSDGQRYVVEMDNDDERKYFQSKSSFYEGNKKVKSVGIVLIFLWVALVIMSMIISVL